MIFLHSFTKSRTREYGDAAIGNSHGVGFITWLFLQIELESDELLKITAAISGSYSLMAPLTLEMILPA